MTRAAVVAALLLALIAAPTAAGGSERRCGWLHNPTPANWWLDDRDGQWVLAVQGGYQAPGMDRMRDMAGLGWVKTNGNYGHGCACMTVRTDRRSGRVTEVIAARPVPLRQCRADKRLPPP